MTNMTSYLDWRGDLTLEAAPLNEVDNLLLSYTVIPDYTGIVPAGSECISIKDAVAAYYEKYGDKGNYMGVVVPAAAWPLVRKMSETERFGNARLSGFINRVVRENNEQFAAMVISLREDLHYICFRGTDDTIAAWKENFLMAVDDAVPARTDALAYLTWVSQAYPGQLIIGGHSKGGNLAVYAAVKAAPHIQDRIVSVYSHDGPGFKPSFYEGDDFKRIADRVTVLMPQYSIVGTFFSQQNVRIIKSSKSGLAAHDGFNWEVLGTHFIALDDFSASTKAFDKAFDDALNKMDYEERTNFINDLFDALSDSGALTTLTDMTNLKLGQAFEITRGFNAHPELKAFAQELIDKMRKEYFEILAADFDEKTKLNLGERWQGFTEKLSALFKKDESEPEEKA